MSDRSFLRDLFDGHAETPLPYTELEGEAKETLDLVIGGWRKFADDKIDPVAIEEGKHMPPEVLSGLGEVGVMGITIPDDCGGLGLGFRAYCRVLEEIGAVCASTGATIGAHQSIGLKPILLYGSDAQKKKWLPDLAEGKRLAAFALTEPEAGSDAQNLKCLAVPSADGSHYVLNGEKLWTTNGGIAEVFTIFARVPAAEEGGKDRITCFIVESSAEGFKAGPEEKKMGLHGSSTTALVLENVKVPAENVVGEVGQGFRIGLETLNHGRLSLGAGCVGAMRTMRGHAAEFANQRETFGRKIVGYEMIRSMLARMDADIWLTDTAVTCAAGLVDAGCEDFSLESAACKVIGSESLWRTVNAAVQVSGGNGYMREYPYERFLRDARINLIFEGTNEILRIYIALTGMKERSEELKALAHPLSNLGTTVKYVADDIKARFTGRPLTDVPGALEDAGAAYAKGAALFQRMVDGALSTHRKGVIEKQLLQARIADVAMDLYVLSCAIGRAAASGDQWEAEVTNWFGRDAIARIEDRFEGRGGEQDTALLGMFREDAQ